MSITLSNNGRLCNQIFRNLSLSLLARKYDLYVEYSNFDDISNKLGIELHVGNKKYNKTEVINDNNYLKYLNTDMEIDYNLNFNHNYFQQGEISNILYNHLKFNKTNIIDKNPYKERYENNNDLFLHIRLTDAKQLNVGIDYYISCINKIEYDNVYIGSDNFNDDLIKEIKNLHKNVIFIDENPIRTIQFGSTCKNIVLSQGTFSAVIGYLSFFSNVHFPNFNWNSWSPKEIFFNKGWNAINLDNTKI